MSDHAAPQGVLAETPGDAPVFIVGCGRSGTTMLRLMLDSHPLLAIPGESNFIRNTWEGRRKYWRHGVFLPERLLNDILHDPNFATWGVPPDSVRQLLRPPVTLNFASVVAAPFQAYASLRGKERWGDKTPIYVLSMPDIAALFPKARFIHLIRDGRNVALSYLAMSTFGGDIWQAAWRWREWVSAGRRHGATLGEDRYMELRYEDLVAEPDGTLRTICRFLGMEFDPSMLEYHRTARTRLEAPSDRVRFHLNTSLPPQPSTRDWREDMEPGALEVFEAAAGRLLTDLGYERAIPRLSPRARALGVSRHGLRVLHVEASRGKKRIIRSLSPSAT